MSAKIVPLNNKVHKDIKVKNTLSFDHAKSQHLSLVVVHEFSKVAIDCPVVFVKDPESGQFRSVAMLGLEPNENLFYSRSKWKGTYIPANLRAYPFALAGDENSDQLALCIDESSKLINKKDGEALFNDDGSETEFLNNRKNFLSQLIEQNRTTKQFIKFLTDNELLAPQSLSLNLEDGSGHDLNGLYVINEKKLNELSDEVYLDIRKRGYMAPIYSQLASMNQLQNLGQLKVAAKKIADKKKA
tara:strand:+ start:6158 stop:6889 length:732 start_codon:yes stop_codon:yes gene_type:complete